MVLLPLNALVNVDKPNNVALIPRSKSIRLETVPDISPVLMKDKTVAVNIQSWQIQKPIPPQKQEEIQVFLMLLTKQFLVLVVHQPFIFLK